MSNVQRQEQTRMICSRTVLMLVQSCSEVMSTVMSYDDDDHGDEVMGELTDTV